MLELVALFFICAATPWSLAVTTKPDVKSRETISPALDPASTLCDIPDMRRLLHVSKPSLYKWIEDGTLNTFMVGARRMCTLADIQACIRTLSANGKKQRPSARKGPQYGRPRNAEEKKTVARIRSQARTQRASAR